MGFGLLFPTTFALIYGDQFPLFHVELLFFVDGPFMESTTTQGFALCFVFEGRFLKGNDVSHICREAARLRAPR